MYGPGIHKLALKNTHRSDGMENRQKHKIKKPGDFLNFAKKHNHGTIVERHLEDGQYNMRIHDNEYTQSDMEEFDRTARLYNPTKEGAATPQRPKNTLNTNKLYSGKRGNMTGQSSEPDA